MEENIPLNEDNGPSRGYMKQVKTIIDQSSMSAACFIALQIVAAVTVSLFQLINASCTAIPSTLLYSLERGSEGITISLKVAALARRFK